MAIGTFAQLKDAITDWADRSGDAAFEARVPDFIRSFEAGFSRAVRVGDMEQTSTLTTAGDGYPIPADCAAIRDVWASSGGSQYPLQNVSGGMDVRGSGSPQFYYVQAGKIYTAPEGVATLALRYYAKLPALSDTVTTNWLLTKHPDAYLFGCLIEAYIYARDEQRAALMKGKYDDIISQITNDDASRRWSGLVSAPVGVSP